MKNYLQFFAYVIVIAGAIISCSKSSPGPVNPLIGSWKQVNSVITGCASVSDNQGLTNCTTDCETFVFTAATLKVITPGSPDELLAYKVSGNAITITPNPGVTITFIISGTTITLTIVSNAANGSCTAVTTCTKL